MKRISGTDNRLTLHFPTGNVECLDESAPAWQEIVDNANIQIEGDGNQVDLHFGSEEEAVALLKNIAFNILIVGNHNEIKVGKSLALSYSPGWGAFGLHLVIGTPFDHWMGTPRSADHCRLEIGEHVIIVGAMIFLLEDDSHITIGNDTMISWGIDIWCTDSHTITDMDGNPTNHPKFIEIGDHVWIGKNVKIGKNVRIDSNNIIGWGSTVTKSIEGQYQLAVGTPARVVKNNVRWDGRTIKEYMRGTERRKD